MFYFPVLGGINTNFPMVGTDRVFYLNSTVAGSLGGSSIDSPFKTFADYHSYAQIKGLTGAITIWVLDGGYYEDISFDDIVGNNEELTIYAPFATFKDVSFVGEDNVIHNHCRLYAGYVIGNVVMSRNSELYVTELGTFAGTNTTDTVSTAITFDTRQDNEDVFIQATNFDGTMSVASLVTAEININLHLDILRWGTNNDAFYDLLATNQEASSNIPLDIYIKGKVNGVLLPMDIPQLRLRYGKGATNYFPLVALTSLSFQTTNNYYIEFHIQDVENLDFDNLDTVRIYRDVQGGVHGDNVDNSNVDLTLASSSSLNDHTLKIDFTMTNASRQDAQPDFTPYVLELEMPVRQYQGNTKHASLRVFLLDVQNYHASPI